MKKILVLAFVCLSLSLALAQSAPAPLPGYQVSLAAGYSLLTGAQNNNGFFSSVGMNMRTFDKTNSFSIAARGDYFSINTPSSYVIAGGPEFRFQFSRASFLSGKVFQPFANVGAGAARSSCSGCSNAPHFALKIGGGLDMVGSPTVTYRLFEVDYIHSTIFPNNAITLSNFAQVMTGLKLNF